MDSSSSSNIVRLQRSVVCKLFAGMNQPNLVHLDSLLFLQLLFHSKNLILWLKVHGLLTASQCLDEDLEDCINERQRIIVR